MEFSGKIQSVARNIQTGRLDITFSIDTANQELTEELFSCDVDVTVKKHRESRSLPSNALFHILVSKLAKAQYPPVSFTRMKNELIGDYGCLELTEDGKPVVYKTNVPPEKMLEQESVHAKVIRGGDNNSWFYQIFRGTHTYNSKEMSVLIDGTLEECRQAGIDVKDA